MRRDNYEKINISKNDIFDKILYLLGDIQNNLYLRALKFREEHTFEVNDYEEFKDKIKNKEGFVYAYWDGATETEKLIKKNTHATIRCIPLQDCSDEGKCIITNNKTSKKVIFAQSY